VRFAMMRAPHLRLVLSLLALPTAAGFAPLALPMSRAAHVALSPRPHVMRTGALSAAVVVTDMDETLITKKSTGYVIKFLIMYRAFARLALLPLLFTILKLLSMINSQTRTLAVRLMYYAAFRGVNVQRAKQVAEESLGDLYVRDLQDPAATAVLDADDAVIITASPTFMAQPWLSTYLGVKPSNVYGAELVERNGRFTGAAGKLPIGQRKVELLEESVAADAKETVGYGDHPTDVPFLRACSKGVLVHKLSEADAAGCEYEPARPFDQARLEALLS